MNDHGYFVLFAVIRNHSLLLIREKVDDLWTLPRSESEGFRSYRDLAHMSLYPFFSGLVIEDLHLIKPLHDHLFDDSRIGRASVFEAKIVGDPNPEMTKRMWFANSESLVTHVLSPDIVPIVSLNELRNRLG